MKPEAKNERMNETFNERYTRLIRNHSSARIFLEISGNMN